LKTNSDYAAVVRFAQVLLDDLNKPIYNLIDDSKKV